ncbi:MAG: MFS transporter [Deltaproteobacteria bacterium]|jgi:MFS family permease|nr:MFS transporter [Deltaproteobacteria bacterium]
MDAQSPNKPTPLWTWTFATFLITNFCIFMGFNMLLPTLSLYLTEKRLSEREIGLVIGCFTVTSVTARLLATPLSRRFGSLNMARVGLFLCAAGTPFFFIIASTASYFAARLAMGAGFGLTSTLLVTLGVKVIPPERIAEGMGYLGLGATVALACGPLAGLFVEETWGFETMFVTMVVCYVLAILVTFNLPNLEGQRSGAAAAKAPGSALSHFWEPKAVAPASLMFLYGVGVSGITAFLAIFLHNEHLPSAAVFFAVATIGTVFSRVTAGRIYDHHGHQFVIPPALLLVMAAVAILVSLPGETLLLFASLLYGLGAGCFFPSAQTLTITAAPEEKRTLASAYFFVSFDLGIGIGAAFMGFVANHYHSYRAVFVAALAVFFLLLAHYVLFLWPRPKGAPPASAR